MDNDNIKKKAAEFRAQREQEYLADRLAVVHAGGGHNPESANLSDDGRVMRICANCANADECEQMRLAQNQVRCMTNEHWRCAEACIANIYGRCEVAHCGGPIVSPHRNRSNDAEASATLYACMLRMFRGEFGE